MKTTKEMIEVMTAYDNGAEIEYSVDGTSNYTPTSNPNWDWNYCDYRIKEQKKTVTISKVLFKNGSVWEGTSEYIKEISRFSKDIKLLDTYEVEL